MRGASFIQGRIHAPLVNAESRSLVVVPLVETGRVDEAIDIMRRVEPLAAEHAYTLGAFGAAYAIAGRRDDALRILDQLEELAQERYVSLLNHAHVLAGLGETDEMMDCMEEAYKERSPMLIFSKADPIFDRVRSNQWFQSLLKKIGL